MGGAANVAMNALKTGSYKPAQASHPESFYQEDSKHFKGGVASQAFETLKVTQPKQATKRFSGLKDARSPQVSLASQGVKVT